MALTRSAWRPAERGSVLVPGAWSARLVWRVDPDTRQITHLTPTAGSEWVEVLGTRKRPRPEHSLAEVAAVEVLPRRWAAAAAAWCDHVSTLDGDDAERARWHHHADGRLATVLHRVLMGSTPADALADVSAEAWAWWTDPRRQ